MEKLAWATTGFRRYWIVTGKLLQCELQKGFVGLNGESEPEFFWTDEAHFNLIFRVNRNKEKKRGNL